MKAKRFFEIIHFSLLTYPSGILLGLSFLFFRFVGKIRIEHPERLPKRKKGMILVPNHPSEIEPVFLPALFFLEYLIEPFSMSPYSAPDEKNWKVWYLFPLWPMLVFIPRGNRRREFEAVRCLRELVSSGHRVIIFGEGGRTYKGTEFVISPSGEGKIRPLKPGLAYVSSAPGATVVPIWVDVSSGEKGMFRWLLNGRILFRIGTPFSTESGAERQSVLRRMQDELLRLADERA